MSEQQIAQDLGRKISDQIEDVLRRELKLATIMLPSTEVVLIYMQLAAQFGASAIDTAICARKHGSDPAELYGTFATALAEAIERRRVETLAAVARKESLA